MKSPMMMINWTPHRPVDCFQTHCYVQERKGFEYIFYIVTTSHSGAVQTQHMKHLSSLQFCAKFTLY